LQNLIANHCCPILVHPPRQSPLQLTTFVCAARTPSTSPTCISTHCRASFVRKTVLHSYTLLVCRQHCRPVFIRIAEPSWYPLLSYISTCCSSAINIIDLHSYALQNLDGTHCCATLVCATSLPSIVSTCIRTHCRTLWVHTAVLYLYILHATRHYHWLHSYMLLACSQHR